MKATQATDWHALAASQAVDLLASDPQAGLSAAEVAARLERHGPNQMTAARRTPPWLRFLLQFHQPLIYILLAATLI